MILSYITHVLSSTISDYAVIGMLIELYNKTPEEHYSFVLMKQLNVKVVPYTFVRRRVSVR